MNKDPISFSHKNLGRRDLGKEEIVQNIRNTIESFVFACINSDFDVIVPVQEEGLAIFLPQLKERKGTSPEIIPSNSLFHIEKDKLKAKTILIVEAAVRTGGEITEITNYIEENFQIKSTSIAAFLVLEEFKHLSELEIPIFHVLSPNQYLWAKEVVVEYLLNEVFVHFADPPMWEFNVTAETKQEITKLLLETGHAYIVPELNEDDDWVRVTLDDISLIDRNWLLPEILVQEISKIRILLNKKADIVKVLPLFYPKILSSSKVTVTETLDYASKSGAFDNIDLSEILRLSKEVKLSPYNTFRWVSTIGSILLLGALQSLVPNLKLDAKKLRLSAPIPNLYQYSCSETILAAFENLARDIISLNYVSGIQLALPGMFFKFDESKTANNNVDNDCFNEISPIEDLVRTFSKWVNQVYVSNPSNLIDILNKGLPLEDVLENNCESVRYHGYDQALDRLIDEGFIKPRLGYDKNSYLVRTVAPGGESIRIFLRSMGSVLEGNLNN
jgi:hypothetical protein